MVCALDRVLAPSPCGNVLTLATLPTPSLLYSDTEMVKLVWETSLLSMSCHPGLLATSQQRSGCPWAFCEGPGWVGTE